MIVRSRNTNRERAVLRGGGRQLGSLRYEFRIIDARFDRTIRGGGRELARQYGDLRGAVRSLDSRALDRIIRGGRRELARQDSGLRSDDRSGMVRTDAERYSNRLNSNRGGTAA